tara:strand:+ start:279 stop:524 length:246 start_codon:yes stop_codon:yes gene_type:complete
MAKVISAVEAATAEAPKIVLIKHTRVMKNANGNDVTVMDYQEEKDVDSAIAETETRKASLEASLAEVEAELVEYKAIKDAE